MTCVLFISSTTLDVDRFLRDFPRLRPDSTWHAGDPRPGGGRRKESGCTLVIAEARGWETVRKRSLRALATLKPMLAAARRAGANVTLDYALYVGGPHSYTSTAVLRPEAIRALAASRATVVISAYPVQESRSHGRG